MVAFFLQLGLRIVALIVTELFVLGLLDGAPMRSLVLPLGVDRAVQPVAVSIDGVGIFSGEELPDVGIGRLGGHGHIDAGYFEIGIGGRWAIPLHVVEPWRWHVLLDPQRRPQRRAQMTRLEVFHSDLVLLAFEVYVTMRSLLGLLLVLEEGVVQDLVVNLNLAHLRLHALPHLLLERLGIVCLASLLTKSTDSCLLDEVRQLEGYLVYATLVLQVAALLRPVPRNWHRIPYLLALEEEEWVLRRDVPRFHQVWPLHLHLEVKDFHLGELFALLLCHLSFGPLLIFPVRIRHRVTACGS